MLSREGQEMEKILKALKMVVLDMKKRLDDQINAYEGLKTDQEGLKTKITGQDGEIQALSNMVNQLLERVEGGASTQSTTEGSLPIDDAMLKRLEETLEITKNRLDQLESKIEDLAISQQALASLEVAREGSADSDRVEQLEGKLNELEGKLPESFSGDNINTERLIQLEAKIADLETAMQVTPSEAADMERVAQLEAKIAELESTPQAAPSEPIDLARLEQVEAKLAEIEAKVQEGAPSEGSDRGRSTQLEEKVDSIETKVFSVRGKLAELEDMLTMVDKSSGPSAELGDVISRLAKLEQTTSTPVLPPEIDRLPTRLDILENTVSRLEATQATPSSDLTAITRRLESVEALISSKPVERVPERERTSGRPSQGEVASIGEPTPAPGEALSPKTGAPASGSVLTMKDRILTIVEELVSCSAMQIAMKLQLSTASIISDLRQLEVEGRITLSGDVETNPDVKLA